MYSNFRIQFDPTLFRLDSREINPRYASSNWILFKHFDIDRFLQKSIYLIIRLQYNEGYILYETIIYAHTLRTPLLSPLIAIWNFLHGGFPLPNISLDDIALRLSPLKLILICDIIEDKSFTISEMAE